MLSKNCLLHTLAVVPPVFQAACPRQPIDSARRRRQDTTAAFNQAAGFSSPSQFGRQAAVIPYRAALLRLHSLVVPFPTGNRGTRGFTPAGSNCRSANPFLLFPAPTFSSVKRGIKNQFEKVLIIMNSIRKGYSRPITAQPLRTFPTLLQASAFVDRLTAQSAVSYRFNIQQTAADCWTVARVVSGGAA